MMMWSFQKTNKNIDALQKKCLKKRKENHKSYHQHWQKCCIEAPQSQSTPLLPWITNFRKRAVRLRTVIPLWKHTKSRLHSTNMQIITTQSSVFWSLTGGQLTAWWQSQMHWGQASVVIEILSEQNLVCVIIVHRARNEAKIHSTWCIHCLQPNTHQAS